MTYELAKRLKDAGFPQEMRGGTYQFLSLSKNEDGFDTYDESIVYVPSLSNLIEACGDITLSGNGTLSGWMAYDSQYPDAGYDTSAKASTPEEAVALLWLELNKK